MARAAYSTDQRQRAIELYGAVGVAETARRVGIPKTTISSWARRAGIRTQATDTMGRARAVSEARAQALRAEMRTKLLETTVDLLDRMVQPHQLAVGRARREVTVALPPAAAVRDYAVSVGILIDKLRLEEGSPTARTESVVEPWNDEEASALAAAIRAELARRGDASGADTTS